MSSSSEIRVPIPNWDIVIDHKDISAKSRHVVDLVTFDKTVLVDYDFFLNTTRLLENYPFYNVVGYLKEEIKRIDDLQNEDDQSSDEEEDSSDSSDPSEPEDRHFAKNGDFTFEPTFALELQFLQSNREEFNLRYNEENSIFNQLYIKHTNRIQLLRQISFEHTQDLVRGQLLTSQIDAFNDLFDEEDSSSI